MPNMDAKTSSHLSNLTVGFQAKQLKPPVTTCNNSHLNNSNNPENNPQESNVNSSLVNTRP